MIHMLDFTKYMSTFLIEILLDLFTVAYEEPSFFLQEEYSCLC